MAKFQAGFGASTALAGPRPPAPAWPALVRALVRTLPGRGIRGRSAPGPYSPLADMVRAAGAEAASAEEKHGRAWRGKYPRNAHPRKRARRGEAARGRWTPPAGHLDAWGRAAKRTRRPGAATLTASGPRWAGPGSPASPARPGPPTRSSSRWGHATHSAAAPGGAFVPKRGGACNKCQLSPSPDPRYSLKIIINNNIVAVISGFPASCFGPRERKGELFCSLH